MDLKEKPIKFSVVTLGCKVNQYESEAIAKILSERGHVICDPRWINGKRLSHQHSSDIYVINTCTVTRKAAMQSRQAIRQAVRSNPDAIVVVTGCYAQTQPEVVAAIGGVDFVAGHHEKAQIPDLIFSLVKNHETPAGISVHATGGERVFEDMPVTPVGSRTRPFLKIQDGCNACCTYCIVPHARGKSRSLFPEKVLEKILELKNKGYHETVLTGIHLGAYGKDLAPPTDLFELLLKIRDLQLMDRVRLSSVEPGELSDEIIDLAKRWDGLCPHFHIPLQSGDNSVLRKMNRPYQREFFRDLVLKIHDRLPHAAIGIDCLIGFPGETDDAFSNTYEFVEQLPVSYLHVFPFSAREGTPAWSYSGKVGGEIIKERCRMMRSLGYEKKQVFYDKFREKELEVLVEHQREPFSGLLKGMSSNYIPVLIDGSDALKNSICRVTITGISENLMVYGRVECQN